MRDIQVTRQVQKVFTRKITANKELSHWDTLKELGMYSLQRRKEGYCMIYTPNDDS